jgi:hypothetical protein
MTKTETIEAYGKKDGNDDHRYEQAIYCAGMTDVAVWMAFRSLINLENMGYVKLVKERVE